MELVQLLWNAHELNASDLHISVGAPPVFRVHGELKRFGEVHVTEEDAERMAREIIPEKEWGRFLEMGEFDGAFAIPDVSRFRVNVFFR